METHYEQDNDHKITFWGLVVVNFRAFRTMVFTPYSFLSFLLRFTSCGIPHASYQTCRENSHDLKNYNQMGV